MDETETGTAAETARTETEAGKFSTRRDSPRQPNLNSIAEVGPGTDEAGRILDKTSHKQNWRACRRDSTRFFDRDWHFDCFDYMTTRL